MKFLKNFALGLLWAFLSPLLAALLVLFAVYALGVYFVECFKCLIRFFQGKSFFPPLEEDLLVKKIQEKELKELIGEKEEGKVETSVPPPPQQVYVQQNFYTSAPGMPFPGMGAPLPGSIPFPQANPAPLPGTGPAAGSIPAAPVGEGMAPLSASVPPPPSIEYKEVPNPDEKKEGGTD